MTDFEKHVTEQLARIEGVFAEDHRALRGNGHKGALDRLADAENKIDSIEKRLTEILGLYSCVTDLKADIKVLTTTVSGLTEQVKAIPQMLSDIELLKNKRIWWRDLITAVVAVLSMICSAYAVYHTWH